MMKKKKGRRKVRWTEGSRERLIKSEEEADGCNIREVVRERSRRKQGETEEDRSKR